MSSRVDSISASPFFPDSLAKRTHNGDAPENENLAYTMVKPALTSPIRHLLAVNQHTVELSEKLMEHNIDEIGAYRQELEACQQERIEKLKESLSSEQRSGFFGLLAKIGSFILSGLSIILGAVLITTGAGTIAGGILIAAGLGQLATAFLEEIGGWDWIAHKIAQENEELRVQLRVLLPAGAAVVCGLASLVGAGIGWSALQAGGKLLTILQLITNLTVGVTTGAKGFHQAEMAWAEADHVELKKEVFCKQEILEELTRQTTGIERLVRRSLETTLRIINTQS